MVSRLLQRQFTRLPALLLAGSILFATVAFRPFGATTYEPLAVLIGLSAALLVLLAEAMAWDHAAQRHVALALGGASGMLLAPAFFLFGFWSWYAGPSRRFHVAYYVVLALGAAIPAVRQRDGWRDGFGLAMLGLFIPTFALLCLRWFLDRWTA